MNISACASRVVLRTPLFLLLVVASEFALSQVVIRERVPIRPSGLQPGIASTGDPASEAYVVAPSDGTMQITGLYADQAEAMIPQSARLVITSPLVQRADSIWSYCSSRYYGPWHSGLGDYYNACTQSVVHVNSFSTVEGFDRTIFFPVHEGDTVRFAYWSNDWIDRCEVSSGSNPWSIHLFRSSDCYPCDSISVWIYLSYADSGFANLHVQALRDTVVYADSSKNSTPIAVVARSTLGREVQVNEGLLINFSVDSVALAKFISPAGDTVASPLNNVTYVDARNGRVKIVASRSPSESLVRIGLSSTVAGDPSKTGVDSIWCARGVDTVVHIVRTIDTLNVFPHYDRHNTTAATRDSIGFDVEVTFIDHPVENAWIYLPRTIVVDSGGHSHSGNRPKAQFQFHQPPNAPSWTTGDSVYAQTDATGRAHIRFRASAFGGIEKVFAILRSDSKRRDSICVRTRVPDLVLLPEADRYVKVGGTVGHHGPRIDTMFTCCRTPDDNHYCTFSAMEEVTAIADSFAVISGGLRLTINDQSLKYGGLFDKDTTWTIPHSEHRLGTNADLPYQLVREDGGKVPMGKWKRHLIAIIGAITNQMPRDEPLFNHVHAYCSQ